MLSNVLSLLPFVAVASSSVLPRSSSSLSSLPIPYDVSPPSSAGGGSTCTVNAFGEGKSDVPSLLSAVKNCGDGGTIILPSETYNISEPITLTLNKAKVELHGTLNYTGDIDFWVKNSYRFPFQNQSLGMIVRGSDYVIDGMGWRKGGIDGNGQQWYTWNKGASNKFGRPMSLAIVNSTRAIIQNLQMVQPQFWASLIWDSSDVIMQNIFVNASNSDPDAGDKNWLDNTDGSDTYRAKRVLYQNWIYQGGDDCLALKPNSTQIYGRNVTCLGGPGIAFGSIGQYPGVTDIIQDVLFENMTIKPSPQLPVNQGVYFKSWIGVEVGVPPNGGGGGQGYCKDVVVRDIKVEEAQYPLRLISTNSYLPNLTESYANTSTFKWDNIRISDFSGTGSNTSLVDLECSSKAPCKGWSFDNIDLKASNTSDPQNNYLCQNMPGVKGLPQCHG